MGARGGHFAIVVLSALGRLTMVVSSTIPALCASIGDSGVVEDDRREPPRIEGHRPGPLGILSDQDSLLATTARCQWCSTTGSPSNRPHSVHGPSKSRAQGSISYTSLFFRSFYFDPRGDVETSWFEAPIECRPRHAFAAGDSRKPVTEHRLGGQPVGKARSFPMTEEDRGSASGSRGC